MGLYFFVGGVTDVRAEAYCYCSDSSGVPPRMRTKSYSVGMPAGRESRPRAVT